MHPDEFFLRSLEDLRSRLRPDSTYYDALLGGALLRKLVLDGDRLVDVVNRDREVDVTFRVRVADVPTSPDVVFWYRGNGLDPESGLGLTGEVRVLGRDAFLAVPVGVVQGQAFAVRDVIRFVANILGGVHRRPVRNPLEHAIAVSHGTMNADGAYRQLAPIAKITLRVLEPLETAVRG